MVTSKETAKNLFEVEVERKEIRSHTFTVRANTCAEAIQAGISAASSYNFNDAKFEDCEYMVTDLVKLDNA